ncbi:MAG: hypothetical protein OES78_07845 [Chromatiales bacterium]|jgi:hypothetical protein|nr:hypothetical protein [Chromatiales bacterium]MDH3894454.1 hypothetical protein [Chromatiales bacterium]MDH3931575.1 hypothetical protein [Chromatiales bacterium]MDH4014457.1 hypothetical protein [Chromatiales bacterium]
MNRRLSVRSPGAGTGNGKHGIETSRFHVPIIKDGVSERIEVDA